MKKKLIISVIIPTLNSQNDLPNLISSMKRQTYPKSKLEVIICDGGSTDNTLKLAKKEKFTIIHNSYIYAEPGIYLGMKKAKGDLFIVLASDNIFKDRFAFEKLVNVFAEKTIYAAFPKHDSEKNDSIFTKYINTFTDPVNHFIYGFAANARTFKYMYKTVESNTRYDVYDFTSSQVLPILGLAQGFMVRKAFTRVRRNIFDDITPIRQIYLHHRIAYVHSVSLFHHTIRDADHFMRKQRWFTMMAIKDKRIGIIKRVKYFTKYQRVKFYIYPLYGITFLPPLIVGIYCFLRYREPLWLFHPVISFLSVVSISYELLRIRLGIGKSPSRL